MTGAGTGTFVHERDSGVFNEIQAGSYVFMDRDYGDNQRGEGDIVFEHALFVRTTVMSRPTADRAVVDAGLKASSVDSGMPARLAAPRPALRQGRRRAWRAGHAERRPRWRWATSCCWCRAIAIRP